MYGITYEHLNNLRIISKIRPGQRLDTTNGLTIYEDGIINWLFRKYYRDTKDETVYILQNLYKSIDQCSEQLISDIINIKDKNKLFKKITIAINLAENLKTSISGIENLSKTYSQYPKTVSVLEGIIYDIAIITYTQLIDNIPMDKLTKTLKENVLYNSNIIYDSNNTTDVNNTIYDSNIGDENDIGDVD